MEKRSYISSWQVVVVLVVTRLLFSTAHFVTLGAGRSIQDVLPAVPVGFVLNLLVAVPLLALSRRFDGRDPLESTFFMWGKAAGTVVSVFYFLYFGAFAMLNQAFVCLYYRNSVMPDAGKLSFYIPFFAVVAYGVCKGMESIMRFGTIVFILFAISIGTLTATLIPAIRPNIGIRFLLPLFYNGPDVMLKEVVDGFNSGIQVACVAFLMPFLKSGTSGGKLFFKWDLVASLFLLVEFGLCVAVLGPFGTTQFYPLQAISAQSSISVFDRLDSLYGVVWILNGLLTSMLYTFLQVNCLTKLGLNKHRKIMVVALAALNVAASLFVQNYPVLLRSINLNWLFTAVNLFALVLLPLVLLLGSLAGKVLPGGKEQAHEAA